MTRITVWPDKYQSGWERTEDNEPLTANGGVPVRFPVVDVAELVAVYTTDAHFVPYYIRNLPVCPRVNAGGLVSLLALGLDVVFDMIVVDVDAPGVVDVQGWCARQLIAVRDNAPELWATLGWYATRGGLRLLWALPEATSREDYLRLLPRLRHALTSSGVHGVDRLIDWQRCYRLPHVVRDGVAQQLPLDMSRFGLLPELPGAVGQEAYYRGICESRHRHSLELDACWNF